MIDIEFQMRSDTPAEKDPDSYSPTLKKYHKLLWSKKTQSGIILKLKDNKPKVLIHISKNEQFIFSSDAFGHTYSETKRVGNIAKQIPQDELERFISICNTIGAYIIFPAKKVNNKMTINGARGLNAKIGDRFDITLECIRLYYLNNDSPLKETLDRYSDFFSLFKTFKGYVDFFLLQDLVNKDYNQINFWLPFKGFNFPALPNNINEYLDYKKKLTTFIKQRNNRIYEYSLKTP